MNIGRYRGLKDKAERMTWFLFDEKTFLKVSDKVNSLLEVEQLDICEEVLDWSRADWFEVIVLPIWRELQQINKNKSEVFIYLKFVENLSTYDISKIFKTSPYIVVQSLFYFLLGEKIVDDCYFSRSSEAQLISLLDEKTISNRKESGYLCNCFACQDSRSFALTRIYKYKKSVADSDRAFIEFLKNTRKPKAKVRLFEKLSLFT
tara:strand:- start:15964 stop:16578 length:615 start_codon:yes stop_codon:yes gene_type:complete